MIAGLDGLDMPGSEHHEVCISKPSSQPAVAARRIAAWQAGVVQLLLGPLTAALCGSCCVPCQVSRRRWRELIGKVRGGSRLVVSPRSGAGSRSRPGDLAGRFTRPCVWIPGHDAKRSCPGCLSVCESGNGLSRSDDREARNFTLAN